VRGVSRTAIHSSSIRRSVLHVSIRSRICDHAARDLPLAIKRRCCRTHIAPLSEWIAFPAGRNRHLTRRGIRAAERKANLNRSFISAPTARARHRFCIRLYFHLLSHLARPRRGLIRKHRAEEARFPHCRSLNYPIHLTFRDNISAFLRGREL